MPAILRFITVMQKILIIICIVCFIPTSVFVFIPKQHAFSSAQLATYADAYQQVYTPFVLGYNGNGCTFREGILSNEYCYRRADPNYYMVNAIGLGGCTGFSYQHDGLQFCSGVSEAQGGTIYNTIDPLTNLFKFSNATYPMFKIAPPFTSPRITYYHYLPSQGCRTLASKLTHNIQDRYSLFYFKAYQDSARMVWFCTLPILAVMILLIVINEVTNKFNLRKYILMACFTTNVLLIAQIVKVIAHFTNVEGFQSTISSFSACFVKEQKTNIAEMANFDYGVGFGFVFFMGIVALLIFLSMAGQLVAKLLELKYYSSRDMPEQTGVQLSDLKTSLRSRRINNDSVTPSNSRAKYVEMQSNENY